MALFSGETDDSESTRDIKITEEKRYEIDSSLDTRMAINKMKKDAEEITQAIEDARNNTYQKKVIIENLNMNLNEKKNKMQEVQVKLENAREIAKSEAKKVLDLEVEVNNIKGAIQKIKEVGTGLDPKYLEQSQSDLTDALVKITSKAEKTQSDFTAAKKIETMISEKLDNIENDYNKLEEYTENKTRETKTIISNITATIEQIIKSHDEMTAISKNLLKSTTSTKNEVDERNHNKLEQYEAEDTRIAI